LETGFGLVNGEKSYRVAFIIYYNSSPVFIIETPVFIIETPHTQTWFMEFYFDGFEFAVSTQEFLVHAKPEPRAAPSWQSNQLQLQCW
jgi:hypothetical protein